MTKTFRLPIQALFSFFNIDNNQYEIPHKINRELKIKIPNLTYSKINYLIKKVGNKREYVLSNNIKIRCDENHLVKSNGNFNFIKISESIDTINGKCDIVSSTDIGFGDVYDLSIDSPHEYITSTGIICHNTAAAKILYKNIPCDFLYINASDENGVGLIRDKIKGFASSAGFNPIKIIVLDECDQLSAEAQSALRNLIETYSLHTRFILTCNYVEKMIPPIVSRCQVFKVEAPPKKDVAMLLKNILDKESIIYTIEDLGYIVNTYYPDMRKIINFAQQSVTDGKLVINKHNAVDNDVKLKLLELLKTGIGNPATFNLIRQLVADSDIRFYDEFYSFLYQHTADFSRGKEVVAILIIAECVYQSALVVDREITFMSCIARLMKELK